MTNNTPVAEDVPLPVGPQTALEMNLPATEWLLQVSPREQLQPVPYELFVTHHTWGSWGTLLIFKQRLRSASHTDMSMMLIASMMGTLALQS